MEKKNREELEAFAKKMHDEGAAGFAAGLTPWETWDDFEDRVGSRVWQGTAEQVSERARPGGSFGDRVLTAMTALAVATLAIGIAGVYMSRNSSLQLADNSTQLSPAAPESADSRAAESGETSVALNDASLPATTASQGTASTTKIDMAAAPSRALPTSPDSDSPLQEAPVEGYTLIAMLEELPATAAGALPAAPTAEQTTRMDSDTPLPVSSDDGDDLPATPEQLPAATADHMPAASTVLKTAGMAEPGHGSNQWQEPQTARHYDHRCNARCAFAQATDMKPEPTPATAANNEPSRPVLLSQLTVPAESGKPLQAAGQNAQTGKGGDWSINLASYTKQSAAEKVRGRFLARGVATDQVVATVNGKTYYRLRVTGFESRQAALTQSAVIKEKLGLGETWVTKQ